MPRTARIGGSGLLIAALTAGLAAASPADAISPAAVHEPAIAPTGPLMSSVLAAEAMARAHAAQAQRPGIISGVVRSLAGSPVGNCVTVVGKGSHAIARTGPGGRYVLGGLRPGRYRVTASACATAGQASSQAPISASWTTGPATVTVRGSQVSHPAPISLWYLGKNWLSTLRNQATPASAGARSKLGSISGLVTGRDHPQRGVCAVAFSFNSGASAVAVTTKSGAYHIGRLRPGQYNVMFVAGVQHCGNDGNWLEQWYPRVNSPFPTNRVKIIRVRAGKAVKGIDAKLKAGGEIAGIVRTTSGKAIRGICVFATAQIDKGQVILLGNLSTDEAGRYALHGVFARRYQVEFFIGCGSTGNYAYQWWRDASSAKHASTIRIVGAKKVTDVNARLRPGATVTGVVKVVTVKGKPLAGVCVDATGSDGFEDAFANTSSSGRYRLEGLAAGRYQIQFDPSCIGEGNAPYLLVQRNVTVSTGQTVTGFNALLPLGGGISGVVTGPDGHPAGGVCVVVDDFNGDATQTRANGTYSISGVQTGSFDVQFFAGCGSTGSLAPQFYHQPLSSLVATPIRFRPNTMTPNINVAMLPGGTLAGVVTNTAGRRLSGICVTAIPLDEPAPAAPESIIPPTHDGRYLLKNLSPGPYDLVFGCGGYGTQYFPSQPGPGTSSLVAVNAGVTTRVGARLSRAGVITGTVTRSGGKSPEFVCVEATPAGSRTVPFPQNVAFTNQNGRYRLGGLAPGRYLVQFLDCRGKGFASQWYRRQANEAAATPVKVLPGRTDSGINAVLTAGGSITGRVTKPSGKPARAICVDASSKAAHSAVRATTGKSGRYRLNGLSTGRWSVTFSPCFHPKPDLGSLTLSGIRVTAPRTHAGVNVKLPAGGSISGTIVSRSGGAPIIGACVLVEPVNPDGSFGSAITDGHGRYVARHLAAGKYHVLVSDPVCGGSVNGNVPFAPQWYRDQPTQATARTVRLSAGGAVTGINGALTLFGAVTGTVETRGHVAVAGECVTAVPFRATADPFTGFPAQPEVAITGRNGSYNLTQLAAGRYKIEFSSRCGARGFATQWWDNAGSARSAKVITVRFAVISGIDATLRR